MPSRPPVLGSKPKVHITGSADLRPNGSRWRRRKAAILKRHPLCSYCLARGHITAADVVDHIVALSLGGSSDDPNLIGACRPCNDEKRILEQQWVRAGWPISTLERAATIEGTLAWFVHVARNNIAA